MAGRSPVSSCTSAAARPKTRPIRLRRTLQSCLSIFKHLAKGDEIAPELQKKILRQFV